MVALDDYTIVEIRLIQSLWTKKSVQFIANMLERPIHVIERKIQEMNREHKVELYKPVTFERKVKQKEVAWAAKQLEEKPKMVIREQSEKVSLRINSKTVVFVHPDDLEKTKKKYGIS